MKKDETKKPNRKIQTVVKMMFEDIPYSEEVDEAQGKIIVALDEKFDKIKDGRHEDEALEELLSKYGRLSQMAKFAGYPSNIAAKWRDTGEGIDVISLNKELKKQRYRTYLVSAFSVFALVQISWFIYNLTVNTLSAVWNMASLAVDIFLLLIPLKKILAGERKARSNRYDTESFKYLRGQSDKYSKKLLNSIALLFAVIFVFSFSELSFYFFGNSKSAELTENFFNNGLLVQIPMFILIKNILLCRLFQKRINLPRKKKLKAHVIGLCIFSSVFWIGLIVITAIMSDSISCYEVTFVNMAKLLKMQVYNC